MREEFAGGVEQGLHIFHGILRYAGGRGGLSGEAGKVGSL
jgi:hypothetical protein